MASGPAARRSTTASAPATRLTLCAVTLRYRASPTVALAKIAI
jgi:hypothetical protein